MATFAGTVAASTDDCNSASNSANQDGTGSVVAGDLTNVTLSPGNHSGTDRYYAGARFLNVTIANAATINSATFSMKCNSSWDASPNVVALRVRGQDSDTTVTFGTTAGTNNLDTTARPRTTATSAAWGLTNLTAGTRYSIDIAAVIQEIVNRAGWASGNSMVMIVDLDATCSTGEWQDFYSWDDATDRTNNPPQLAIDYTEGGAPNKRRYTMTLLGIG